MSDVEIMVQVEEMEEILAWSPRKLHYPLSIQVCHQDNW